MQPNKDQKFIFSDVELELIKNTFSENDELLYAVRNVLLQFELSDAQKQMIRAQVTPEIYKVLLKRMLPTPTGEFPLTQLPSILTTITGDLKSRSVEDMELLFSAKATEIAYLEQQFAVLKDLSSPQPIKLTDFATIVGKSAKDAYVHMTVYLFLLGYIDPALGFIKSIAGEKKETIEEQKKRLDRDSNK